MRFPVLALAALAGFLVAGSAPSRAQQAPASVDRHAARAITVQAYPLSAFSIVDSTRRVFGKLTFLGGFELRSKDPDFGGFSSALIDPDGKGFVAISDQAHWFTGRFVETNGQITGVENARIAPMLAPNGRRMKDTRYFDTEGLARIGSRFFVAVERVHTILRFEAPGGRPGGRGQLIETPEGMKSLSGNQGVESLGVMPPRSAAAGAFIAIAERAPKHAAGDDIPGWLIGGRQPGSFVVKRKDNFDITDLAFLPGGDMLILERRFAPLSGIAFRIRRIALGQIRPGATLDGETVIEADMSQQIDNMEALMVHRADDGRVILTLMSDDNFSLLQRTLVLRFAMDE